MTARMDLIAGREPDILLALGLDDTSALDDRHRFRAHLSLGGGLDPTWLDLFSEACRAATDSDQPVDFIDARLELAGPDAPTDAAAERTIERVDAAWIDAVANVPDVVIDSIAGRWIELVEEELGELPREEKPWIRQLAGDIVRFARASSGSGDVLFAWSL